MYKGGPWTVVCVCVDGGEAKDQSQDNHFKLSVATPGEVDAAHEAALALKDQYGIRKVESVTEAKGMRAFRLQDLNFTWWEITNVSMAYYDDLFDPRRCCSLDRQLWFDEHDVTRETAAAKTARV